MGADGVGDFVRDCGLRLRLRLGSFDRWPGLQHTSWISRPLIDTLLIQEDQQASNFVRFPERVDILEKLCSIESYAPDYEPLFALAAERLANKAYDRSAFVFILIELIYEFEVTDREFSKLLSESVLALTDDIYLAASALDAYQEVKATLAPMEEPSKETADAEVQEPAESQASAPEAAREPAQEPAMSSNEAGAPREGGVEVAELSERLMLELQRAQKQVSDLGFDTRMAIEMTLGRPNREAVRTTLHRIAALRQGLRSFEENLQQAEQEILRRIGLFDTEA